MKNITKIIIIFSLFSSFFSYSSSDSFDYENIKKIKITLMPEIVKICKNDTRCINTLYNKLQKSFHLLDIENGEFFFNECFNENLKDKREYKVNSYLNCTEHYKNGLEKNTIIKSLNHIFLKKNNISTLVIMLCKKDYSINSKNLNTCINTQNKASNQFLKLFFDSELISLDKDKFKSCTERYLTKESNGLTTINFRGVISCIK